jgi:hypothetical protein
MQVPRLMQMPSAMVTLPLLMLMQLRLSVEGVASPLLQLTLLHPAPVVVLLLHVSPHCFALESLPAAVAAHSCAWAAIAGTISLPPDITWVSACTRMQILPSAAAYVAMMM